MAKMRDLVKMLEAMQALVSDAGVILRFDGRKLSGTALGEKFSFEVVRLNRPSAAQVKESLSTDKLLVLENPSLEAVAEARSANHIVLPGGGFRIIAPGLVLVRESPVVKEDVRQVRLRGASGVVAETLLMGGRREWSVSELAREAQVSAALAHRVLKRLESNALVQTFGSGPNTMRRVTNSSALAQTWRDEDASPKIAARGYLYGVTSSAIVERVAKICPQGAMGGVMAANYHEPTLTQIPFPVRFWVPFDFSLAAFEASGLELTEEGANLEIAVATSDSWQPHRTFHNDLPIISRWRAWMEVGEARGRTGELAHRLFHTLQEAETTEETLWK